MRKNIFHIVFSLSFLHIACERQKEESAGFEMKPPEITEAKVYVIPKDQMAPPIITPAREIKNKAISKPKVIKLKSNVYPVAKPVIVQARAPKICVPGKDGYFFPELVPAIDSPFAAGLPEVTLAREPQLDLQNPSSFMPFTILQGLKSNWVFPVIQDRAGNLWVASFEGGVSKYDGRSFSNYRTTQGLSSDNVWSMLEDRKGNLWFGTLEGGLNKFDGRTFTHFTERNGLNDKSVISMLEDRNGNLWFGTEQGGVNKYDGKSFTYFTTAQGLIGNHVRSIIEDDEGNLWFGTKSGISKFNGVSFANYTTEQGLSRVC